MAIQLHQLTADQVKLMAVPECKAVLAAIRGSENINFHSKELLSSAILRLQFHQGNWRTLNLEDIQTLQTSECQDLIAILEMAVREEGENSLLLAMQEAAKSQIRFLRGDWLN